MAVEDEKLVTFSFFSFGDSINTHIHMEATYKNEGYSYG